MSSDIIYAKPDFSKVRYNRKVEEDGGEWEEREMDIYENTDVFRDDVTDIQSQEEGPQTQNRPPVHRKSFRGAALCLAVLCLLMAAGIIVLSTYQPHREKKLPAGRNSSFRVFTVSLRVLCLLVLAGIITRYILVTLKKNDLEKKLNNLNHRYNQSQHLIKQLQVHSVTKEKELQSRIDNLIKNYSQSQNEVKQLQDKISRKSCPEGWKTFGCSCYFKSTEKKSWYQSRKDCEKKESDLVMINSKEEQDFVTKLNPHEESWIGLWTQWSETENKYQWKWLDGSQLTVTFLATEEKQPTGYLYAACCDRHGRWRSEHYYQYKNWICEKKISCFL